MLKIGWFRVRPEEIAGYWPVAGMSEHLKFEYQVRVRLKGVAESIDVSFEDDDKAMQEAMIALDAMFLKPTNSNGEEV